MGSGQDTVCGRVTSERNDCPERDRKWDVRRTITACVESDRELEAEGLELAPQSREAIKSHNERYIRAWVLGCHFEWLNPRSR